MRSTLNYESELSDILHTELLKRYGLYEERVLYPYFCLRFFIFKGKIRENKRKKPRTNQTLEMVPFLLSELHIPYEKNKIIYKNETIPFSNALGHSLENILSNWEFRSSLQSWENEMGHILSFSLFLEKEWKEIVDYANRSVYGIKKTPYAKAYWQFYALEKLNHQFLASPRYPERIDHISYPPDYNDFHRTWEEQLLSRVESIEFLHHYSSMIPESELEDYMIRHLELLEEGLTYLDHQVVIQNGRIDVLARDKEGHYVIIELKVQEDKDLVRQAMYYPEQFKSEFHAKEVRMITMAPSYPNAILVPLQQLHYVEMYQYIPSIEKGKIKSLKLDRVS